VFYREYTYSLVQTLSHYTQRQSVTIDKQSDRQNIDDSIMPAADHTACSTIG